ncbi:MAG: inositol 2-dehydrogenase [Cohaesibacteraceae bacterium]
MVRIGLLGCGRIGQVHALSIEQVGGAQLVAVADAVPEAAEAVAASYGAAVRSIDAVLTSGDVDAVIIGTPTDTHYDLIHQAAANGKAIFCEKPVDLDTDRIRECVAAVEATGVLFMAGFNRRFDPNFASMAQQIRDGVIGNVELVTILSRDPSPPPVSYIERSGGLFRDMMIHDFDMARFLPGDEVVSVSASGSSLVDPAIGAVGDVDTAAAILTTASGTICQISNSRRATYGYDQRVEVHGSKGLLRADNQLESTVELATGDGFRRSPTQHFFLERYAEAYRLEIAAFIAAIENGEPPSPTIEDGLRAQMIADAATVAHQESRVVALDNG